MLWVKNLEGKMLYLEVYKAPSYDQKGNVLGTSGVTAASDTGVDIHVDNPGYNVLDNIHYIIYRTNDNSQIQINVCVDLDTDAN